MTAEIAILNTHGIALAADSAVTFQNSNSKEKKIYNSSDKVFSLSKFYPIGIMIFGNASFLGLPWEIIIKNYRSYLWKRKFDTLNEYALNFLKYLETVIPDTMQEEYFRRSVSAYYFALCEEIKKEVEIITEKDGKISLKDVKKSITEIIKKQSKNIEEKFEPLPNVPENFSEILLGKRIGIVDEIINKYFEKLPISTTNRKLLHKLAFLINSREVFSNNNSGVVVAGYGEKEDFPSLIEIKIDGVIDNVVKYKVIQRASISYQHSAIIVPFAQREMVCTFMEGVNPEYQESINVIFSEILNDYPKLLVNNIQQIPQERKQEILEALKKESNKALSDIMDRLDDYRTQIFVDPVLTAVGALPKDELAVMAETLVNLTSFKRKMSLDAETVGGPIDVALISKGDGFVWIKRKHYFSPELNHQFFSNYYMDKCEEEL